MATISIKTISDFHKIKNSREIKKMSKGFMLC